MFLAQGGWLFAGHVLICLWKLSASNEYHYFQIHLQYKQVENLEWLLTVVGSTGIPRTAWNMHHRAKLRPYKMNNQKWQKNDLHLLIHAILERCIASNKLWKTRGGYTTILKYIDQSCPQTLSTPNVIWYMYSLVPRPPFNPPRGKGSLVNIVQHFCTATQDTIWLADLKITSIPPVLGFLTTNHLALPTYLAHPPTIYWSPPRQRLNS